MRVLILFLLLWGQMSLPGQTPELNFTPMPAKRQLSSQFATCITQDNQGYIWIGTIDGLNRFDGHTVRVYRNNEGQYNNLANNNIRTLYADSKNRIWVGTIWGLSVYNSGRDSFKLLSSSNDLGGLVTSFIYQVSENTDQEILVAAGKAIYKFNEETERFIPIIELKGGDILSFTLCPNNDIWVGQDAGGGIRHFSYDENYNETKLPDWISSSEQQLLREFAITDLDTKDSVLWVATRGNGVKQIDFNKNNVKTYLPGEYQSSVVDLYRDKQGFLWSCDYSGLKRYNPENDSFDEYYGEPGGVNNVKSNPIGFFQDRQMNYWVIYSEKGFDLSTVNRGFQLFNDEPESYWPLGDVNVLSVAEDRHGNLWTGGFNGGITVFHWAKGSTSYFHPNPKNPYSLSQGSIFDLHLDQNQEMWIASYEKGLQKFDPSINGFMSFTHDDQNPKSIGGNDIRGIEEDEDGNFWLVVHGVGIDYFDKKTHDFRHFTPQNSGLSIEWTNNVLLDSKNNLWVATSNGLNRKEKGTDTFKVYLSYDPENPSSIKSNDIICIHESLDSTIWIGTTNGLYSYSPEEDNFIFHSENFSNQYICAIEHDSSGDLWVSTHGGISHYNAVTGQVFNFDIMDGLQSNDFNINSSYYDGKNHVFFGGPGGLNVVNPEKIYYNLEPPTVVLTD
ncbi:MAG: histidine kinase, partial [Marinifilaceae bacterium]|nr:histidine kinase [Marinifilaceae bacterium]